MLLLSRELLAEYEKGTTCLVTVVISKNGAAQYVSRTSFEWVAVDILRPLLHKENGNKYLMVVMDYFSKCPEVVSTNSESKGCHSSENVYRTRVAGDGVPLELHSD